MGMVITMDLLIIEEIKGHFYCLYIHNLISFEQYTIFMKRLYKFSYKNEGFSYLQIIKYVLGDKKL